MNKKDIRKLRTAVLNCENFDMGDGRYCIVGIGLTLKGEEIPFGYHSTALIDKFTELYRMPRKLVYDIYWCDAVCIGDEETSQEAAIRFLTKLEVEGIPKYYR